MLFYVFCMLYQVFDTQCVWVLCECMYNTSNSIFMLNIMCMGPVWLCRRCNSFVVVDVFRVNDDNGQKLCNSSKTDVLRFVQNQWIVPKDFKLVKVFFVLLKD